MEEDKELYQDFLKGNEEAFVKIMDKYRKNLIYFIQQYVKSIDTAEDLAQDVFVYLLIHKDGYHFEYSLKGYLYLIGKSRALNYIKRQKKVVPIQEDIMIQEQVDKLQENVIQKERQQNLRQTITTLPKNYQDVIYLIDIERLTYQEAADILNKSTVQVKMIIHRARRKLKILLEKEKIKYEE